MNFVAAKDAKFNRNFSSSDYYSNTWMASQDVNKWRWRITVGSGGRGKTYSGRKMALKNFKNKGRKFVWMRLSVDEVKKLLQNDGMGLFPAELLNKYKMTCSVKGNAVYLNDNLAGYVVSVLGYAKEKGVEFELEDMQLKEYTLSKTSKHITKMKNYDIFVDEIIRESGVKNMGSIPHAFQNQIENIVRKGQGIRVFIYANFLKEIQDIEEIFEIKLVPGKFGIYRNPNRKVVVEYLEDSEEWKAKRKTDYASDLNVDGGRFTNKPTEENHLIVYNHQLRGSKILYNVKIDFGIYTLKRWKSRYVLAFYKGNENRKQIYALKPTYITSPDHKYNLDITKHIFELHRSGLLSYTSYSTYQKLVALVR